MKIIDIAKKYGLATYNYPFEPYEVHEGFRGKPVYDYDKCIGCTACAVACPSNAINVKLNEQGDKLVWEFDCARCIFCGRCDEVCPTNAVVQSDQFELAVKFDKKALKIVGELELQYCEVCNSAFTTKRLISYNLERLERAGWSSDNLDEKTKYIRTCPECKKNKVVEESNKYFSGVNNE
ncbi:formate hydrogenlyase complex iron-sulfur subunit [Arcobacter arenosus]|uniref:4Fe-4S dicluster domain-containing protein n=1 Tax=Arcobacter arenosus TaxID=2576037 RepID=A0A5R8XXC2_9BACT|nr:formate hydrogenlyase complex iron-sulfur subunit [Arcobacter arenosus]TLP35554.1 4Fe-4S dicluster domain-containing protein [Arcobacter arenosus]